MADDDDVWNIETCSLNQKRGYIFENNCKLLFDNSWCCFRLDQVDYQD